MAIKKIENITVDGENFLFGGFIYDVNLDISFGENYSTCRIRFINESGQYDIGKNDIGVDQIPSLLKIGSKIELVMYPIDFSEDDSESGKLLEVKYVDESVKFLDKILVELNGRIANPPGCIVTVGEEKFRRLVNGKEVSTSQDTTGLIVPDIEYTLPQLYAATNGVKQGGLYGEGASLLQNADLNSFFRDYRGSLREVLTAWGNDLGFGFYWENGKVNVVDLTTAVKLQEVEVFTNALIANVKPNKVFRSYSKEDTTARATNSFFAKNGNVFGRGSPEVVTNHTLTNLMLQDIPWVSGFSITNEVQNRLKMAHFGDSFFLPFFAMFSVGQTEKTLKEFLGDVERDLIKVRKLNPSNEPDEKRIEFIGQNLEPAFPVDPSAGQLNEENYDWYIFTLPESAEPANLFTIQDAYKAGSRYWGRYYRKPMTWGQFERESFSDGSIEWHRDTEPFKNTKIAKDNVENFSQNIRLYEHISLKGFIEDFPSSISTVQGLRDHDARKVGTFNPVIFEDAPAFSEPGYIIKEIENPIWTPLFSDSLFVLDNLFIVEGNTINENLNSNQFIIGIKKDSVFELSDIEFPSTSDYKVQSRRKRNATIIQIDNKIEFNQTTYPANFCGGDASKLEINQIFVNEEDIRIQGEPNNDDLSESNFNSLHNLFSSKTTISKDEPYFSVRIESDTIDLPGSFQPTIGNGLQNLNISFGDNGVNVSYSFGTRNMRLRSAGFYINRFYDARNRRMVPMLGPNFTIVGNALRGRIS